VKFMPQYFFDFTDGKFNGCDRIGKKLPDVEAAAREAVSALANISKDVRKQYQDRVLALKVRDQSGETVLNLALTLAVTYFPERRIESDQFKRKSPVRDTSPQRLAALTGMVEELEPDAVAGVTIVDRAERSLEMAVFPTWVLLPS
jgi:hypothetical protein